MKGCRAREDAITTAKPQTRSERLSEKLAAGKGRERS